MTPSKSVIITGGNSGLGYQCAKVLAEEGSWQIIIASRNQERVEVGADQLTAETGCRSLTPLTLDLGSFASIRSFVDQFAAADLPPLCAIICNAGVSLTKNRQTVDGIDMTFGVNHLGHYLLVHLLTKHFAEPGRVVFVSSGTHVPEHKLARHFGVPAPKYTTAHNLAYPDTAPEAERIDNPAQRYSTSKLCNMLCAYEFARQFQAAGMNVSVFGIDPGLMPGTGLTRDFPQWLINLAFIPFVTFLARWVDGIRLPEQSGRDLARLILDESLEGKTALYFDGHQEAHSSNDSYDGEKAADLWQTSQDLCRLMDDETRLTFHPLKQIA
ncbi:SDR family NAD(P)-dependent oxidoreductase [Chloroflexi bacterium TSY]|nr:SDR family NAD(P)-dependent oxidoreductase [Chloroflexi bacterium TSY]